MAYSKKIKEKFEALEEVIESQQQEIERLKNPVSFGSMASNTAVLERSSTVTQEEMDLLLGFRVIRGGQFHGLWQLYKYEGGVAKPIGAETTRMLVMNIARNEIAGTRI